ncbi:MipA/OmpV family protein, partial [Mesorhizobium sp. M7A.F.Ca.CA.001.07.2.1]
MSPVGRISLVLAAAVLGGAGTAHAGEGSWLSGDWYLT